MANGDFAPGREESLKPSGYLPRVVDSEMHRALNSAGWVVLEGARACGKTWTGLRFAQSAVRLDIQPEVRIVGEVEPTVLLEGRSPRLIDEWQVVPAVWNHIRHACDATERRGLFILAGSAQPADDVTRHTGAGRVRRIRVRPMSLFESGYSGGEASVAALLNGEGCSMGPSGSGLRDVAEMICRGGWPGLRDLPIAEIQQSLRDYLGEVARTDVRNLDGTPSFQPEGVWRLILSLARNVATEANTSTLAADVEPEPLHRHSVRAYLQALRRLYVLEEQPAWSVRLRSRTRLRKSPKLHLADPSLAAAALGANPGRLMTDPATLGLLFESMVVRDLRVLSQPLGGRVMHLRYTSGKEVDAVVECPDGRRMLAEIKLGGADAVEAAAGSLLRLAGNLSEGPAGQRPALVVITATGYGYTRSDGVHVVPATALGP